MKISTDVKLDFKDVLIRPKRSTLRSRAQVNLEREFKFRNSQNTMNCIPIISANMDTTGTFEIATSFAQHKMLTAVHKHYSVEEYTTFAKEHAEVIPYIAVSSGTSEDDSQKIAKVLDVTDIKTICVDVANGYSSHFLDYVRLCREKYPRHNIMAGNVVTGEMVEELLLEGADVVKVGIGPGSVCTTRKKTGVGYPQLSAVIECADSAHGLNGHIISDGGCSVPGDICKALGAGADFVMLGGMLAGHDESGGELISDPVTGKKAKLFYGMSSSTAMNKHSGGVAEYRASEGKTVSVPYRGPIGGTIQDILGGIRSACTYTGAAQLKELSKRTTFIRVTQQTNDVYGTANA